MSKPLSALWQSNFRPFLLLGLVLAAFALMSGGPGVFTARGGFSVFQHFATIGLVALGLGLTMLMREFDLSVAGMMGLGGCIAVLAGNESAVAGLAAALAVGLAGGLLQAWLMIRLGLGSVPVTLGGLLTFVGAAYVVTGNRSVPFDNMEMAIAINAPLLGFISVRALVVVALFVLAALVIQFTRAGRDLIATGSDRHGALIAGVNPDRIQLGVFACSGAFAALAGAMLSFGLSSASPSGGVADILVPAVAAAILGGVSLSGGVGRPLGIAAGVLVLCVLRTGLTTLGVAPYVHDIVTGAILLAVAIVDGPHLRMRLYQLGIPRHVRAAQSKGELT
ncbi:ABC transporter permease [Pusillimonas noertemannii]|uniref:Monosaccharide ABC transporter membrane protein (CUT2 family) n=1 Tax=Pusillimonas noertemannii TaxID=305977 RepID=A0A2U1CR20_9BURK|nr:ABC transporter permease [Pusillimonas noertemannii]NYT67647.1 ABC transporter permease [Pusillimonas noertemannii]PVY68319.1 monosaccharide ABC transporter membrane protein (CUT2 family) [Pusillimonas noertemannii]TFL12192.1 ABC transporter permease [Pusillimonas noertemannii]